MKTMPFVCALRTRFALYHSISTLIGSMLLLAWSLQPIVLYGQTYTDILDFNYTTDGAYPYYAGHVAQGRDGNLYGGLRYGASNPYGGVYKITPSGSETTIYNFTGGNDGYYPYSGLTLGTDGNFYGTTLYGGGSGCYGTVFKITPAGSLTTLHCFTGTNGDGYLAYSGPVLGQKGLYGVAFQSVYTITSSGTYKLLGQLPGVSYAPLLLANDGNLYGTTESGGNGGYGTVFRLSSNGAAKIIYSFDRTHGSLPIGPLVQGSDGDLYGTTSAGGAATNPGGTVFKLTLKGSIAVLKNFDSQSSDGAYPYAGLVAGTDGNFYGLTTGSPGAQYGTLFKISKSGTYSLVNSFDNTHGAYGYATPVQHTNGIVYGETYQGGQDGDGVFWKVDAGISPFVSIVGYPAGTSGTTVEILGQGFTSASSVNFGTGSATFTVVNDTYLTAKVPDSGTTGTVAVTTNSGTLKSAQTFKVLPVLASFSPTSGSVGTQVTITGSGFIGATSVMFNGVKATFTVNSGTQITTTIPTGATTGKIKITTSGGTATSSGPFTVT